MPITNQVENQASSLSMLGTSYYKDYCHVATLSQKYSHLNIDSFVEKVALRL